MKKVRLNDLENNKNDKLKQYKLDKESIEEFRSKIKQVSEEENNELGNKLVEYIFKDDFNDDYEKVIELIYNGADANIPFYDALLLNHCCRKQYNKTLIVLIRAGIDIYCKDEFEYTPIMMCAEVGNKEILELLVLMDTNINYENSRGETALSLALENGHMECVDILINAQARFNLNDLNKYNLFTLKDKELFPVIDKSTFNLIKEAEDKLNSLNEDLLTDYSIVGNISLLAEEQIESNNKLDILKKYGIRAVATDFTIFLGCNLSKFLYTFKDTNNELFRVGSWWTKSFFISSFIGLHNQTIVINANSIVVNKMPNDRRNGIRPILPYSLIKSNVLNKKINSYEILEIEFGEYPQSIVDDDYSQLLERLYNNRSLRTTGKTYITDSIGYQDTDKAFRDKIHTEYEYNGSKYIRFIANSNCDGQILSDGTTLKAGQSYWVKIEPIIWLVDKKSDIALSKKILVSGIQFNNSNNYDGIFVNTFMYKYLNEIFAKDIIPSKINNKQLIKK